MKKINKNKNYEGMGFVEALIAIMITGISAVVLMQMATNTMQSMVQNETIDTMTQYAIEGSTMVQNVATQQRLGGDNLFPTEGGKCYLISKDDVTGQYYFQKEDSQTNTFQSYTIDQRNTYRTEGAIPEDGKYFRIFCIDSNYQTSDSYVVVKIVVGQTMSNGDVTKGNNVADYTYYTVVNL